jgi:hypothetical protein
MAELQSVGEIVSYLIDATKSSTLTPAQLDRLRQEAQALLFVIEAEKAA